MRDADYPAFREELVAALLETLAAHPRAAAARCASSLSIAPLSTLDNGGPPDELAVAVAGAASAQATAELAEWLGCTKIALQARPCRLPCGVHGRLGTSMATCSTKRCPARAHKCSLDCMFMLGLLCESLRQTDQAWGLGV